jgi:hypothetical protein
VAVSQGDRRKGGQVRTGAHLDTDLPEFRVLDRRDEQALRQVLGITAIGSRLLPLVTCLQVGCDALGVAVVDHPSAPIEPLVIAAGPFWAVAFIFAPVDELLG